MYWVALQQTPGLGTRRIFRLVKFFGDARTVWKAPEKELLLLEGLGNGAQCLINWRRQAVPEKIINALQTAAIKVITFTEEAYPLELKRIYDPPLVLYWRGKQLPGKDLKIAIVGTRRATAYGLRVAKQLAADLAAAGVGVVSGVARGIDAAAHRGVIRAGGLTWGILGCGPDVVYPPEHKELYQKIMEHGAILSEFPPGTPPEAKNFPIRNRIISGLTSGTVVVEAAVKSGSLITADIALEQNRDVFAVPGPITSRYSKGSNELIKEGARVVTEADDIIAEYGAQLSILWPTSPKKEQAKISLTSTERKVLECLSIVPTHIDDISVAVDLQPGDVSRALLQLEMAKYIRRLPGGFYLRY